MAAGDRAVLEHDVGRRCRDRGAGCPRRRRSRRPRRRPRSRGSGRAPTAPPSGRRGGAGGRAARCAEAARPASGRRRRCAASENSNGCRQRASTSKFGAFLKREISCAPCASSSPARAARSARPPSTPSTTPATRSRPATSARPSSRPPRPARPRYMQADLTDAGDAFAVVRGHDAVIHAAAIPEPTPQPAARRVFHNNLMGVFNTLEAAVRFGVPRFVNVSSETVPGLLLPRAPVPARLRAGRRGAPDPPAGPVRDRQALLRAADATRRCAARTSAASRSGRLGAVGGQLRAQPRPDAARPRRPSRARAAGPTSTSTTSPTRCGWPPSPTSPGHEVFYIASPDNRANRPLEELVRRHYGDGDRARASSTAPGRVRHLDREGRAPARLRARRARGATT